MLLGVNVLLGVDVPLGVDVILGRATIDDRSLQSLIATNRFSLASRQSKFKFSRTSMARNLGEIRRTCVAFIHVIWLKRKSKNSTQSLLVVSWSELLKPNPEQSSNLFSLISVHFSALVCKIGTTKKKTKRSILIVVESVCLICVGAFIGNLSCHAMHNCEQIDCLSDVYIIVSK